MVNVGFSDRGYECFDAGHYLLFSDDNSHELLFHYITQDLSQLPMLFTQYISQRMDITTFKRHNCPGDDTTIDQMKNVLVTAHPYYKHEIRNVLIRSIGDFFNRHLLYSHYHQSIPIPGFSEKWYRDRIEHLMKPLLKFGDTCPKDFYNEYQKQVDGDIYTADQLPDEIENFAFDVPREMPTGLSSENRIQRKISNMLYFLLDISAQGLNKLSTPQRIWLYSNIMTDSASETAVFKRLSLKHPILYQDGHDYSQAVELNRELDDKFRPLHAINKFNLVRDDLPAGMKEELYSAIDRAKTVEISKPYEEYEINDLHQLLYLEILSMVQDNVMLRKCRHCGKYFVVTNRKTAYCDRVDESGLRCSEVGPRQAFQKKMESDEPLKVYNRAYKTHHARMKSGNMSRDDFQAWCIEAKQKLAEVRSGELSIISFQMWLKK